MCNDVCVVCKRMGDALIETDMGKVHNGVCHSHLVSLPISESDDEQLLEETELLM